jgi:glycosyltransferase involved in cell wall biosynthesis
MTLQIFNIICDTFFYIDFISKMNTKFINCILFKFFLMRILFIIDYFKPKIGWLETMFDNVISILLKRWYKVKIITINFDKRIKNYEKDWNLEIFRIWTNRINFIFLAFIKWLSLIKDIDIIHTTTYASMLPSIFLKYWFKITTVATVHEVFWALWYKYKWWRWLFYIMFEKLIFLFKLDKYMCVSNYTKNSLRLLYGISDNKLITIYNWINKNIRNYKNVDQEKLSNFIKKFNLDQTYIWLYYGHTWKSKWLDTYIYSISKILKIIPNFKAIIAIPEWDRNDTIKKIIVNNNLQKNVLICDNFKTNEIIELIYISNVVIVPSISDGFWLVAAEVSNLWKELIVTNIWSLPEVVSGKINFIEPDNEIEIVQAFKKFKYNEYKIIPEKIFNWTETVNLIEKVYKK